MASINTNNGALAALASLRSIDSRLLVNSKQLQTGFRVSDSLDDAAVFAVAQGARTDIKAHASVQASLYQGLGLLDVTLAALNKVSDLLGHLRATLIKASDGSLSATQLSTYRSDATALHEQILDATLAATYNGRNQTLATSTAVEFVADLKGATIAVGVFGLNPEYNDLGTAIGAITDATTATAAYNAIAPLEATTNATIADFAATRNQFENQIGFNENLIDAVKKGLGALVDADIADVAAVQQSLLVQRSLAVNILNIASNNNRLLVGLFR